MRSPTSLLRDRRAADSGKVSNIELFFDLVFVFAVTQLSHSLLAHLDRAGLLHTGLLLLAVWWVWINTSWVTNWLNPETIPVRLGLFVMMLAGLLLSVSIPQAFAQRGLAFAGAYVFMQVGRGLFFLWAVRHGQARMTRSYQRILAWAALGGVFWLAGGLASGEQRLALWIAGLAIELSGPAVFYWVPGLGRSSVQDWDIDGGHMAERCSLFVIIALGESLLVTGATFAEQPWTLASVTGFGAAFFGALAMWWLYFDSGAGRAEHRIRHSTDPGREGRLAYTYLHVLIVAGVIVGAVADELVLAHPDHAGDAAVAAIVGAPTLYLVGNALFKWVTNDRPTPPLSHVVGVLALMALPWTGATHAMSAVSLSASTTAVLVVVAIWESVALRRPAAIAVPVG